MMTGLLSVSSVATAFKQAPAWLPAGLFAGLPFGLIAGLLAASTAFAAPPRGAPLPPPIPAPRDQPYPGLLTLQVDVSDIDRHLVRVRETVPVVRPGPMVLSTPKWIPGEHGPSGPVGGLAGLVVTGNGQRIEWTRDTVEPSAFHLEVPAGVRELQIELLQQSGPAGSSGSPVATTDVQIVKWGSAALYPAGYAVGNIRIQPSIKLPSGWRFAVALDGAVTEGQDTRFAPTSFETLIDSPLFAGRHLRSFDLDPGAAVPVRLQVFAADEAALDAQPAQIEAHRHLVRQAYKLFGSRHYDHYDFLLSLDEGIGGLGIEHHRSSENGYSTSKYFTDWDHSWASRDLLAHEFTHSWNGKFRRPADLWTADYTVPMRDSLLWVYEGQTQYWGEVLAARSGLQTAQQARDALAWSAAVTDARVGRSWRNLQDTTNSAILGHGAGPGATSWTRSYDYYQEGALIWLDADTLVREASGGKRSLDDFARAFFGIEDGSWQPVTYRFDDVVEALNGVHRHDWATFLRSRLDGHGPGAPLDGLARGGYRLVYTDTPTDYVKELEGQYKGVLLGFSIGLNLGKEARVTEVQWEGPAFKAGLVAGATLVAVNTVPFDADVLKAAICEAAKPGAAPIELLVKADDRYRTLRVDYHGGLRYPRLERIPDVPARLDDILAPRE